MANLDSDLLRTFLAVAETGTMSGGALRINRSQSAASVQIKQLEQILGAPVFQRHGRGVKLSTAGEALLPVAHQVVQSLDRTLAKFAGNSLEGPLRIGIPDDHGKTALAKIIAAFNRKHPKVDLTVHCALSSEFPTALSAGELDLAVHEVEKLDKGMTLLREEKMRWVTAKSHDPLDKDPIPVALFDRACWWRDVALTALAQSGRPHRIILTSESVTGVTAAIEAGMAIGVLGDSAISGGLTALSDDLGLGALPSSKLVLQHGKRAEDPLCLAMAEAITRAF